MIVSLNALAAGFSFMVDPTGSEMGIKTDYLKESAPFEDFFIPGVILFTVIGVLGFFTFLLTTFRQRSFPILVLIHGCLLLSWILIQLMMVKSFHVLHLVMGLIGALLIFSGYIQKERRFQIAT
jgi:hypothetical protein